MREHRNSRARRHPCCAAAVIAAGQLLHRSASASAAAPGGGLLEPPCRVLRLQRRHPLPEQFSLVLPPSNVLWRGRLGACAMQPLVPLCRECCGVDVACDGAVSGVLAVR